MKKVKKKIKQNQKLSTGNILLTKKQRDTQLLIKNYSPF